MSEINKNFLHMMKHNTASCFVLTRENNETKLLLIKHKKLGKWAAPGGHIDTDETPFAAARRELLEEVGVVAEFVFSSFVTYEDNSSIHILNAPLAIIAQTIPAYGEKQEHIHMDHIYLGVTSNMKYTQNTRESEDIGWFSASQIEELDIFDNVKAIAQKLLHEYKDVLPIVYRANFPNINML